MADREQFDHYRIRRREDGSLWELGRGAMGITYKAYDTELYCEVALKVINPSILNDAGARDRFLREARAAASLRQENIAAVYRLGTTDEDTHFYAMELCEGRTLETAVESDGPLSVENALHVALQVSRAFAAAEVRQIVHRDIKPANLIIANEREDEGPRVKVIDFGLAKSYSPVSDASVTQATLGFVGTVLFASPEQIEERPLDVRSDIYSLGGTLWFALEGRPPFEGTVAGVMRQHVSAPPPFDRLRARLPACVLALLQHMLEKSPASRPQTARLLKDEVKACLTAIASGAQLSPPGQRLRDFQTIPPASLPPVPGARGQEIALPVPPVLPPLIPAPPAMAASPFAAMPPSPQQPLRKPIIARRYLLDAEFTRERSGRIFRAFDQAESNKVVLLQELEGAVDLAPIKRQAQLLQKHPHPDIRQVLGIEREPDGAAWLVLEAPDGFSMLELLKARGSLLFRETLALARLLADAVDHARTNQLPPLDLAKQQTFIHFPEGVASAQRREELKRASLDTWPPFEIKVPAVLQSSTGEDAPSDADLTMTIVPKARAAGAGAASGPTLTDYLSTLAERIYEMMGGTPPLVTVGKQDRRSRYVPLARLSEAGNALVQQALMPLAGAGPTFPSAADFVDALKETAGYEPARHPEPAPLPAPAPPPRERVPGLPPVPFPPPSPAPAFSRGGQLPPPPVPGPPPQMFRPPGQVAYPPPPGQVPVPLWIGAGLFLLVAILAGIFLGGWGILLLAAFCATIAAALRSSGLGWSIAPWSAPSQWQPNFARLAQQPFILLGALPIMAIFLLLFAYQAIGSSHKSKSQSSGDNSGAEAPGSGGSPAGGQRQDAGGAARIAGTWIGQLSRTSSYGAVNQSIFNVSVALILDDNSSQAAYFHAVAGQSPLNASRSVVGVVREGTTVQFGYDASPQNSYEKLAGTMNINPQTNQAEIHQRVEWQQSGAWIEWSGAMTRRQ